MYLLLLKDCLWPWPNKTKIWGGSPKNPKLEWLIRVLIQGIVVQSPKPKKILWFAFAWQETEAGPDETAEAEPNPVYCYFASEVPVPGIFFLGSQGRDGVFFWGGMDEKQQISWMCRWMWVMWIEIDIVEARDFWGRVFAQMEMGGSYA